MAYYHGGEAVNSFESTGAADETYVVDDLTIIPLASKSFAICELCSRVGRREQFYPRNNKFCSLRCHASNSRKHHCHWRFKFMEGAEHLEGFIPLEPLPQLQHWQGTYQLQAGPIKQSANASQSYEWKDELFGCDFLAAPVSLFKHAPLHEMWDSTFEGMKVEVRNTDLDDHDEKNNDYLWVASVIKVKGYMGLLRYEGFGSDDSKDFWVNLCCSEVNPVGWCAMRGKPLIPPRTIQDKYTDWKKFLVKQLTGARTLPVNFYSKLTDSNQSRFHVGSVLEVLDKNRISQVKVATVCEIVGKRLHIKYYNSLSDDMGFWCHEDSPLIHPVGWAFRVGHNLDAPESYLQRVATGRLSPTDTTPDMFHKYPTNEPPLFTEGMKLEAIDPLNLSSLCAGTIMQILNEGYMMIRIDCYPVDESGGDWFCYHQRSPCIFPVGYAMANNLPLTPPAGFTAEEFSWEQYLAMCGAEAAPRGSFAPREHVTSHGFVAGMRLECTDLMDPRLVCVATIARVVSDLLKIHFDGWGPEYDQWLWARSTDMYPVGWCRAVSHVLQGPNKLVPQPAPRKQTHKASRAPRRRKKLIEKKTVTPVAPITPCAVYEDSQNANDWKSNEMKSLSPPTSVSEASAEAETRDTENKADQSDLQQPDQSNTDPELQPLDPDPYPLPFPDLQTEDAPCRMDVDTESKSTDPPDDSEEPTSESTQDLFFEPATKSFQDSSQHAQPNEMKEDIDDKVIPRLVNTVPFASDDVDPGNWTHADVAKFLKVNDCEPYCQYFANISGAMMLTLSKDEIIELLTMKVGPSLKIFDLIQQLKCKLKKPKCRRNLK